jgi:hypothetical protein
MDWSQSRSQGKRSQRSQRSRLQKLTQLSDYWLMIDVIHNPAPVVAGLPRLFVALKRWSKTGCKTGCESKIVIVIQLALHQSIVPVFHYTSLSQAGCKEVDDSFITPPCPKLDAKRSMMEEDRTNMSRTLAAVAAPLLSLCFS